MTAREPNAIFDEQFDFIQEARIPVSMTGMLNAVPKTPLYQRLKHAGRLLAEHAGDQFVFTDILPLGMSRLQLYEGHERLLRRLYDYSNYRKRAMSLILTKGAATKARFPLRDLIVFSASSGRASCVLHRGARGSRAR